MVEALAGRSRAVHGATDEWALSRLGLKWECPPEPCHDLRAFLKPNRSGELFACASNHVLEVWDSQQCCMLQRLPSPNTKTCCLSWLRDDSFVTGGHDNTLSLWREGEIIAEMHGHTDWIRGLDLNASDTTVLSGDAASGIALWDLPTQHRVLASILPSSTAVELNAVMDLTFLSDSVFCVLQRSAHISLCDLRCARLAKLHWQGHCGRGSSMKLCEDAKRFVTSARGSEAKLWDVRRVTKSEYVTRFANHVSENAPLGFDFLRSERFLASGSDDERACIYDLHTGKLVRSVAMGSGIVRTLCAAAPDSFCFYSSFMSGRFLGLVDTEGDDISHEAKTEEDVTQKFAHEAWDSVTGKYTERILSAIRLVQHNVPFGYDNWMQVIRQSELPACKQLLRDLAAEYDAQLQAALPRMQAELQRIEAIRAAHETPSASCKVTKASECAPPVHKERAKLHKPMLN